MPLPQGECPRMHIKLGAPLDGNCQRVYPDHRATKPANRRLGNIHLIDEQRTQEEAMQSTNPDIPRSKDAVSVRAKMAGKF